MGSCLLFSEPVPYRLTHAGSDRVIVNGAGPEDLEYVDWNITYNFSKNLEKAFAEVEMVAPAETTAWGSKMDWGLYKLNGMNSEQQRRALVKARDALKDEGSSDYWSGSEKVVRKLLQQMLDITLWSMGYHHVGSEAMTEGGVWNKRPY